MLRKTLITFGLLAIFGITAWEFKINILIWSIPKLSAIFMPVQDNIPTTLGQRDLKFLYRIIVLILY